MYKILIIILIIGMLGLGIVLGIQTTLQAADGQPGGFPLKNIFAVGNKASSPVFGNF